MRIQRQPIQNRTQRIIARCVKVLRGMRLEARIHIRRSSYEIKMAMVSFACICVCMLPLACFMLLSQQTVNKTIIESTIIDQAIVVLTRGYENVSKYDQLIQRNQMLEQYFIPNAVDYIIFHEGNIGINHQNYIQNKTIIPLQFVNVSQSWQTQQTMQFYEPTKRFSLNYRNMCNFWFCEFWNYVLNYAKIVRIDTDCKFESDYNQMFDLLDENAVVYGKWSGEHTFVTHGLNNFTVDFLTSKDVNESSLKRQNPSGPYTNVIGLNLKSLRQNALLQEYISAVKGSNNIFIYRWGDLPLWGEALKYFLDDHQYKLSKDVKYFHGSHGARVN